MELRSSTTTWTIWSSSRRCCRFPAQLSFLFIFSSAFSSPTTPSSTASVLSRRCQDSMEAVEDGTIRFSSKLASNEEMGNWKLLRLEDGSTLEAKVAATAISNGD